MSTTIIKTKLVSEVQLESSRNISLLLERGKDDRYFLVVMDRDRHIELRYVEISQKLFWALNKELGEVYHEDWG